MRPIRLAATTLTLVAASSTQAQTGAGFGRVGGAIRDAAGQPVAEAAVAIGDAPATHVGPAGEFAIRGVAVGRATLHARAVGYAPVDTAIAIGDGATTSLAIVLQRPAQALAEVRVQSGAASAATSRRATSAVVIGREQIARSAPSRFSELLRRVPVVDLGNQLRPAFVRLACHASACSWLLAPPLLRGLIGRS